MAARLKRFVVFGIFAILVGSSAPSVALEKADRILILKAKRELTLFQHGKPLKTYEVSLGGSPIGDKHCQGDQRTPEGTYRIELKNRQSRFHRALRVSYPNATDIKEARKLGCNPGGDIMIHGLGKGFGYLGKLHLARDWTLGCIAVTNEEIEEIWAAVDVGTVVEIRP